MDRILVNLKDLLCRVRYSAKSSSSTPAQRAGPIYQPLNKETHEIRICDLAPSSKLSAPLECSLRTVPIDQAGSFVAFSYVWGQDPPSEIIEVDGIAHSIRPNLAAGLRQSRAKFSGRRQATPIWADAICINQNSIEEPNHQVPLMRSIFSGCESGFAWLGESDESSDLAMDHIAKRNNFVKKKNVGEWSFLQMLVETDGLFNSELWLAISRLLQRHFWYRVWIYQEIILPKNLVIGCGSKALPWESFQVLDGTKSFQEVLDISSTILRQHSLHPGPDIQNIQNDIKACCNVLNPLFKHKFNFEKGQSLALRELLTETIHLKSTDPRDKIYGLLGLDQNTTARPITPSW